MHPVLIEPEGEGWLLTERIPLTLINPYLNKGHTLTKLVGTIRANRKNFPKDFTRDKDIPKGSAVFKQNNSILAMKYRGVKDKVQGKPKVVHLLSTKHKANMRDTIQRNVGGDPVQKPEAIMYYNKKMGGVHTIDQQ